MFSYKLLLRIEDDNLGHTYCKNWASPVQLRKGDHVFVDDELEIVTVKRVEWSLSLPGFAFVILGDRYLPGHARERKFFKSWTDSADF